tara:strand:+ start:137 stop:1222 length:1086 start_codon:yes stop_codon:yes gene_type:complete
MTIDKQKVISILSGISSKDSVVVNFENSLKRLDVNGANIELDVLVPNPTLQFKEKIKAEIKLAILEFFPQAIISINCIFENLNEIHPNSTIKNIIAVASGKGGVGKSTLSSNLAIALQKKGFKVGLIDADIYGPSIPLMFDAQDSRPKQQKIKDKNLMLPIESYGVKIMSIGFFSNSDEAIVWRGPMATKALKTIINETYWKDLDYLLIDLPPGTSDIHLSLVQTVSITGALIVTTPQPVALIDASKAISMFNSKNINVPIIGIVENMSWCNIDGKKYYLFGRDGGKNLSSSKDIPLLAELPLDQSIREAGDVGRPAALQDSALSSLFISLAQKVVDRTNNRNKNLPKTKKVEITHNRGCN